MLAAPLLQLDVLCLGAMSFAYDKYMPRKTVGHFSLVRDAHAAATLWASSAWKLLTAASADAGSAPASIWLSDPKGNITASFFDMEQESRRAQNAESRRASKPRKKGGRKAAAATAAAAAAAAASEEEEAEDSGGGGGRKSKAGRKAGRKAKVSRVSSKAERARGRAKERKENLLSGKERSRADEDGAVERLKKGKKKSRSKRSNKDESKEEKKRAAQLAADAEAVEAPKVVCAVCGLKETSRGTDRNCCHKGGSWYGACGRKAAGETGGGGAEVHTFREGFRVCRNASRAE
tara:strand:+ start:126 stop:1001 length:876 start_codon:yes stop_codon:yes gene_type:complete